VFYLEHGYDREVAKNPRPPAELEIKPGMGWDEQLGVAVGVLINQNKSDAIAWVKIIISSAKEEREAWQAANVARKAAARAETRDDEKMAAVPPTEEEENEGPAAPSICTSRPLAIF
jgi:replication fork protection complex subunit Tof1/Swi1